MLPEGAHPVDGAAAFLDRAIDHPALSDPAALILHAGGDTNPGVENGERFPGLGFPVPEHGFAVGYQIGDLPDVGTFRGLVLILPSDKPELRPERLRLIDRGFLDQL